MLCLTMTLFRIGGISDHSDNPVHVDVEGDNMMVNKIIILEPVSNFNAIIKKAGLRSI